MTADRLSLRMTVQQRALTWFERTAALWSGNAAARDELGLAGISAWLLLGNHLRAGQPTSDADSSEAAAYFRTHQQRTTGLFADSARGPLPATVESRLLGDRATRAITSLVLQAHRVLRQRPAYELHILDALNDATQAMAWWDSLNWRDPVSAAVDVASTSICLIHQAETEGKPEAFAACHGILDRLEPLQDARSGLFVVAADNSPWAAVVATDDLLALYTYVRRPVQRVSRIIDSILSLEQSDDGLACTRGTAREALAAVRLLSSLSSQSPHRRADVRKVLIRTYTAIDEIQRSDGTFPAGDARMAAPGLFSSASAETSSVARTAYDLWLRSLTMRAIERLYPDDTGGPHECHFQEWPGHGYHSPAPMLSQHEQAVLPLWMRRTAYADVRPVRGPETPAVSVVVPCYNLGVYLHEAIESVLAQTSDDFEIVVVDDGSTDEYTRLVLSHFERPRTRVLRQDNRGLAEARNEGVRQSRGRYVCCLDPDDRLRPDFIARAAAILDADPGVGFVSAYFEMFDEGEGVFRFESCEFPALLAHNRAIEPSVFRRDAWERVGGYCTTFSSSGVEDWDLWIALIELGYRAEIIRQPMWEYRIRSAQMSTDMYRPDTWGRLMEEMVLRHADTYRQHLAAVIGQHGRRWAELRDWANECAAAAGWWERQAQNWERLTREGNLLLQDRQATIALLEQRLRRTTEQTEAPE